jgi:hypothetical protein
MPSNKTLFEAAAIKALEYDTNGKGTTFSRAARPHKTFGLRPLRPYFTGFTLA